MSASLAPLASLAWLLAAQAQGPPEPAGGIVAIVGNDVITQAELDRATDILRVDLGGKYPQSILEREWPSIQRGELDRLIEEKLFLQMIKKEEEKLGKPYVSEEDIDRAVEDRLETLRQEGMRLPGGADDLYTMHREKYGMKREELRAHLKKQVALVRYLWQSVFKGTSNLVAPQEARDYYKGHLEEYSTPERLSFRLIIINRKRLDYPAAIEGVEAGTKGGADFVELARQWSDEAVIRGQPKDAGKLWDKLFVELKDWHKSMLEAMRRTRKGEISLRVETAVDSRYIKIEDIVAGAPKSFAEVQVEIEQKIISERRARARGAFIARLRAKTRIEVFLGPLPAPRAAVVETPKEPPVGGAGREAAAPEEKQTEKKARESE